MIDLYPPLKKYLIRQGYEVKSEVQNCDGIALRGDESIVVVELKLSINLTLLPRAVARLRISDIVYIGVPKGVAILKKQRKKGCRNRLSSESSCHCGLPSKRGSNKSVGRLSTITSG